MTVLRCLLVPMVLSGCVGGADVFHVQDAEPTECQRPVGPPSHTGLEWVSEGATTGDGLSQLCVPRLEVQPGGIVDCELLERLPSSGPSSRCEALPGRVHVRTEVGPSGALREVCELQQIGDSEGVGWRYETTAALGDDSEVRLNCGDDSQRLAFVGFRATAGGVLDWICTPEHPEDTNGLGDVCGPGIEGWARDCGMVRPPAPGDPLQIWCDSAIGRCGVRCTSDADCEAAGFPGERCAERGFCVTRSCAAP